MRHLLPQLGELPVHPPGVRGRPGEAGLDQHHLQRREALEHALEDQAGQHRLLALRVTDHLLDVVGRPAAGGDRACRHSRRHGCRPAGWPPPPPGRSASSAAGPSGSAVRVSSSTWAKFAIAGALLDHLRRGRAVLERHHHRRLQPRIARGPFRHLPLVGGMRQRRRQIRVLRALAAGQRIENAERDVVRIEMLLGHERRGRCRDCRRSARRRAGRPAAGPSG